MIDFYQALKTTIQRGEYALETMEDRINTCWLDTRITTEQRDELLTLAAECAKDEFQVDILGKLAELEARVYDLEHPTDIYPVWQQGQISERGVVYRYDVTGDGELDLVRYDGGRASTSLSIGKIEGWHLLNRELENVATITRDADGNFIITPIEAA